MLQASANFGSDCAVEECYMKDDKAQGKKEKVLTEETLPGNSGLLDSNTY